MKLNALPACLAALALFAGCREDRTPPSPAPQASRLVDRVEAARPPPSGATVASTEETVAVAPDAGVAGAEAPTFDVIALEHPHRDGVDHLRRARSLRDEGDLVGALAEARRAVADDATDTLALLQVAKLAGIVGDGELAAESWGRIAQLDQEDAAASIQHARALIALKQYALATMSGLDAIERNPSSAEAQHVTGRAYLSGGDLASAITHFEKAVELQPDHGHALNNLGFAYLRANRNADAVEVLEQAADLLPTVAYVHNNLGVALERVGRADDAKGSYALATSLSPKYIKAQLNAARVRKVASAAAVAQVPNESAEMPTEDTQGGDPSFVE